MKKSKLLLTVSVIFIFVTNVFSQASGKPETKSSSREYMELMNGVFDFVERNYVDEVDPAVLYRGALKGMLEALNDPYTLYLDQSTSRSLNDTTSGQFGGVGLSISKPFSSTPDKPAYVE
ncbi:MAG: peptidase S41, partial [Treponema sp.]|nr:peptidase S41 [Treponema sp.]